MHPTTKKQLEQYFHAPRAGLLLLGAMGAGKKWLATSIAAQLLSVDIGKIEHYPYFFVLRPEKNSISIDTVREMQKQLSLQVPDDKQINRVVAICDAHFLSNEAQNALLKTLEEPPEGTICILTANESNELLPTVTSRLQTIRVLPVLEADAKQAYKDAVDFNKNWAISDGRMGLLNALITDKNHPLKTAITQAKHFLGASPYERLMMVTEVSKNKDDALQIIEALQLVAHASLKQAIKAQKTDTAKQWQNIATQAEKAQQDITKNAGVKLVLTDLSLNL